MSKNTGVEKIKQEYKGAFTLAIFARDFALSLHILQNKKMFFISKCASLVRNRASVNAP
jgi:hypothetical protein